MAPRVWLITGTSTGLGRILAELLLKKGEAVVATARQPDVLNDLKAQYSAKQLLVLKLDVNNKQEVKNTFVEAKKAFGRVDVVFNNAGWAILGDVEAIPEEEARKMFETNFWNAAHVSKEAVRFFREENKPSGGLLLTNSSQAGIASVPGFSYYVSSKHAIEGFTKVLAAELDPAWNINVSIIEPGAFYTPAVTKLTSFDYIHPAYTNPNLPGVIARTWINSGTRVGADPVKAVDRIYQFSLQSKPPLHFPIGKDSIEAIKAEIKALEQNVLLLESQSEGLEFEA